MMSASVGEPRSTLNVAELSPASSAVLLRAVMRRSLLSMMTSALLGPPMILAFAAQDMWLMHAGAVERGYLSGLPVLENQPWRGNFHDAVLKDQKKPLEKQAVINGIGGTATTEKYNQHIEK